MAKVTSVSSALFLASLVDQHHQTFVQCYPDINVLPKMHYMIHLPQQILRYLILFSSIVYSLLLIYRLGPLVTLWCMQMEGKIPTLSKLQE